jgi:hypothetical protein
LKKEQSGESIWTDLRRCGRSDDRHLVLDDLPSRILSTIYHSLRARDDRRHREVLDAVNPTIDVAKIQGDNRPS